MKKVLSLLVTFVFLQVQTWALSGGPVYPGNTAAVSGTYAGVLVANSAGNGLGIFVLGAPASGLASGAFAMFSNGGAFYGSIVGVIDPDKLTLTALAQAQQNQILSLSGGGGGTQILSIPVALASGQITADLTRGTRGGAAGGYRLEGRGALTTSTFDPLGGSPIPSGVLNVTVDGFQQSQTVSGTVDINVLTGTQPSVTPGG